MVGGYTENLEKPQNCQNWGECLLGTIRYIEKLKLIAQAVHMQITMIYIVCFCNRMIGGLYYIIQKLAYLALEHCTSHGACGKFGFTLFTALHAQ